jgi:hypothetical protein
VATSAASVVGSVWVRSVSSSAARDLDSDWDEERPVPGRGP